MKRIHSCHQYQVYRTLVGTQEYVFLTEADAKAFVYRNADIKHCKRNIKNNSYIYNNIYFNSKIDFNKWLSEQIKIIN